MAILVTVGISDRQDHPVRIVQQFRVGRVPLNQLAQYVGRHGGTDPLSSVHAYEYDDNSPKARSNGTKVRKTRRGHATSSKKLISYQFHNSVTIMSFYDTP